MAAILGVAFVLALYTSHMSVGRAEVAGELFIFVNRVSLPTKINFEVAKQFRSGGLSLIAMDEAAYLQRYVDGTIDYRPFVRDGNGAWIKNPDAPVMISSPFAASMWQGDYRYPAEYDAETVRLREFPIAPSRLSAVYAFGNLETCEDVSNRFGWTIDQVERVRIRAWDGTRVWRTNMQIASLMHKIAEQGNAIEAHYREELWRRYWRGEGNLALEVRDTGGNRVTLSVDTIWEYLIEGMVEPSDPSGA